MEYVNFGTAGLKISQVALGLGFRGVSDVESGQRIIERAIDLGINLIDCSNSYCLTDSRWTVGDDSWQGAPRQKRRCSHHLQSLE